MNSMNCFLQGSISTVGETFRKNSGKREAGILIVLWMILLCSFSLLLPETAYADGSMKSGAFTYSIKSDNTAVIEEYDWSQNIGDDINIPEMIGKYAVTSIGANAFCSYNSKKINVRLPSSIQAIGEKAFFETDITSINIPASVESIGAGAFAGCENITMFSVDPQNPVYAVIGGVLYNKAEKELVAFPLGKPIGYFSIPEGIVSVGEYAFFRVPFERRFDFLGSEPFMPDSVRTIKDYAFSHSSCKAPGFLGENLLTCRSVQNIGDYAFAYADYTRDTPLLLGDIQSIGDYAFYSARFKYISTERKSIETYIKLPQSTNHIGQHAFDRIELSPRIRIDLGSTALEVIEPYAFANIISVDGLILPDHLKRIEEGAFQNTAYDATYNSIMIPQSVERIGESAFSWANMGDLKYLRLVFYFEEGSNLEEIGDYAFQGIKGVHTIVLPAALKRIGKNVFWNTTDIEKIVLPESVISIGENLCNSATVVLDVVAGSYAAQYASENGYTTSEMYDQDTSWLNE